MQCKSNHLYYMKYGNGVLTIVIQFDEIFIGILKRTTID